MTSIGHCWVNYKMPKNYRWRQKHFFSEVNAWKFISWCQSKGYEWEKPRFGGTYL